MDNFQHSDLLALETALGEESRDPIAIPISVLKAITNNFSDAQEIGCGGFETVYKGTLGNGMVVAVKKLHENVGVLSKNFNSEVDCLIEVKHKNIVQFLGYCSDTQKVLRSFQGKNVWAEERQKLLCFEYLSKGSLADYLTGPSCGLRWCTRYRIIRGICEGLHYLHHHHQPIIHLDLKPQNILLDDNMVAKIADFGLSRRLSARQSRILTKNIAGTPGYFAPEFINSGVITMKMDIYSLGVIIIEILMGFKQQPNLD
ncbi:hypothetical protein CFC21_076054 [Triticum aestivum]|uniref:Protein kinase domain-containing protein n=2 Tax=Triticum aestivum TaxID=4565 RepID=A0A9R1HRU1_WHEAT|nr:hypothetical protein CFC21_076054 [Triticum aestivum]